MKNFSIKTKLILMFILLKIIPLLLIAFISYEGVKKLDEYLNNSTRFLFDESKQVINDTADESINDSIKNLDKKSQESLEKLSYQIANNVASFLYQRDEDILFLSKLNLTQKVLQDFYSTKNKDIIISYDYSYDDKTNKWINLKKEITSNEKYDFEILKDNEKEFSLTKPKKLIKKSMPIYKEITYFDLNGNEELKVSTLNENLLNVFNKKNTYLNSEDFVREINKLKKDEIYVSNVIGEYVPSKIIGTLTKEKSEKMGLDFIPKNFAYAGKENPHGKKFEGIIRFITPIFNGNKKVGYLSFALDHEHIMQYTDKISPTSENIVTDISDASSGNYAFMWDNIGRNISHPRDYFIVGFDKNTGKRVMPWLSTDLAIEYKKSNKEINDFLESYPIFENQNLNKKPNLTQLKEFGNVGLDCRYLNFAPQCKGWMQLTQDGGFGSFIIFWSNVWKLTTAAAIPYYTGQYGNSKRGFGFVTIGANVDEFHSAANETKRNVDNILHEQTEHMKSIVNQNEKEINSFIERLINELTVVTVLMIIVVLLIAVMLSNFISKKIEKLLIGTNKFADNNFDYKIVVSGDDEIGKLEEAFNQMAEKINNLIKEEKELNENLEKKVHEGIKKQREQEKLLILQSRFASMGEMIGNIAHQWRQPLNSLGLVIQNIHMSYEMGDLSSSTMKRSVDKANDLINNMSSTIDDFRNFFNPNKNQEVFNPNNLINDAIGLLEISFKNNNINIYKELSIDKLQVKGYPNEFLQVLINILNNSKDALLEIEKKQDLNIFIRTYIEGNDVVTEIEDNAKGIALEIFEKIFDPYFTTKEEGKGTGIGLYMTKMIIENNMNGKVIAKNTNEGCKFIIKLSSCS